MRLCENALLAEVELPPAICTKTFKVAGLDSIGESSIAFSTGRNRSASQAALRSMLLVKRFCECGAAVNGVSLRAKAISGCVVKT
jgi:hypothetical protein